MGIEAVIDREDEGPLLPNGETTRNRTHPRLEPKSWKWWFLVALNVALAISTQSSGILLVRFYYAEGGNSKWLITLAQTAAFPLLFILLLILRSSTDHRHRSTSSSPSTIIVASVYLFLGILFGGSTILFSLGLSYLSASTYSLICATQLAFIAVFSFLINSQKFTQCIVNSVALLSLSAALVTVNEDSREPAGDSVWKYLVGVMCTLAASAMYSLLFSLMQLSFHRVLRRETFVVVIEMQAYISLVASSGSLIGLFASGDWRTLGDEMDGFGKGRFAYATTLVSTAVSWQVYSVCSTGLIFLVSSLFSSVISTLSLVVNPLAAVMVFHDNMNGVKIIAFLTAIWGFTSYVYQNYLDDTIGIRTNSDIAEPRDDST